MSRSSNQWLLIDLLEPTQPTVVAVGSTVKNRIPLASFIRGDADRSTAAAALTNLCATHEVVLMPTSSGRVVFAEPIMGASDVHGAWIRIAHLASNDQPRQCAWALTWNLTDGTAVKNPWLNDPGTSGRPTRWSIAEALDTVDLGPNAAHALAQLVGAPDGTVYHANVVQHRTDNADHTIAITTRIHTNEAGHRILRGLSHELGPVEKSVRDDATYSLAALVAQSSIRTDQWRAVVDLASLELICWFGGSPDIIAWQYDPACREQRIHLDDIAKAEAMARSLSETSSPSQPLREHIRFLTPAGHYRHFTVLAQKVALSDCVHAALVTLAAADGTNQPVSESNDLS